MALTIATISLCLFIVLVQHLFNWCTRKTIDIMEEHSAGLVMALIVLDFAITFIFFRLLLEINK
jgi:hypothetical protein